MTNKYRIITKAVNGTTIEMVPVASNSTITVRNFDTPFAPPIIPSITDPAQVAKRDTWVRYVRLSSTTHWQYIHIRELMVFSFDLTNVIRDKRCYTSGRSYIYSTGCEKASNHTIDFDAYGESRFQRKVLQPET